MEVYLIRHTQTDLNQGVICGHMDAEPVASALLSSATKLKKQLPPNPGIVFSSHLIRAKKLAKAVYPSAKVNLDKRIAELDFGDWEGLKWSEIPKNKLNYWMYNYQAVAPPGGETTNAMIDRVQNFFEDLSNTESDKAVLFTHAGVIRITHFLIEEIPLEEVFKIKVKYGQTFRFKMNSI